MDLTRSDRYIMLAEDDADEREFFQEALESLGVEFRLEIFRNGKELVTALNQCTALECYPDIVFLDLNMPILNGWETLKEIRAEEQFKGVPIIAILTTSNSENDKRAAFEKGADAFISKPTSFDSLKVLIAKALNTDWAGKVKNIDDFIIRP